MTWLDLLRAECGRTNIQHVADLLGISRTAISLVLNGKYKHRTDGIEARVLARMGPKKPVWLETLRDQVTRASQAEVARRLRLSEATISQVLSGTYKADTLRIERRVRGVLMGEELTCRVFARIPLNACQDVQELKEFKGQTAYHHACYYACRGTQRYAADGMCEHFNGTGSTKEKP